MEFEDKIKNKLLIRGFTEKQIMNNRGLIGATIDEVILMTVKSALVNVTHCACSDEDKRGETSIMCCNDCGKPTEEFWRCG